LEILLRELTQRDARDSERAVAPLVQAEDAIRIDTSERSFEDQVETILHVIAGNAAG
jgi:cytidylate kinase